MNQISRLFLRFFECQNLFEISISKHNIPSISNKFVFDIISIDKLEYFKQISIPEYRGNAYYETVKKRLQNNSNEFVCLAIIDKVENRIAYSCWIRFTSFFDDKINMYIDMQENEAFFFDAYSFPEYRGKGLHYHMMVQRINFCNDNNIQKAFIGIQCFNVAALKVKDKLKYKQITRNCYSKKSSCKLFIQLLLNKFIK